MELERRREKFQSTAQRTAGRNGSASVAFSMRVCFNPPPSAQPGGTRVGRLHRGSRAVSIHRPAHSRAEPRWRNISGATGQRSDRPAHSRAEPRWTKRRCGSWKFQSTAQRTAGRNRLMAAVVGKAACFNPPPSAQPGGTFDPDELRPLPAVSIHRPAHSRAELHALRVNG